MFELSFKHWNRGKKLALFESQVPFKSTRNNPGLENGHKNKQKQHFPKILLIRDD